MELEIKDLTKKFKDKIAVENVNITLTPGVWGLLGANGAGKTTLMRMIAGIMTPTSGKIYFKGKDILKLGKEYRSIFGYLPQDFGCSRDFTVNDYLEYVAALKDMQVDETHKKINELLDILTLSEVRNKKIVKLSGGMRRRVGIAQAMLNSLKILVLDEPTAGLDPGERVRFRNFISEFSHDRIVLISTHIVSDIEYISTQNAIMKDAKILDIGTTEELVMQIKGKVWTAMIPARELPMQELKLRIINQKNEANNMISIRYFSDKSAIQNSEMVEPRLEDLYLWLFPQDYMKKGDII
ncbi:MAG: ABC transporter ATP-binding protein [Clostridioides sp.]|jgi:ABC-type multidrug transport system ATPase subunit|nr:ABC transporter ATP-binding protein [Clostridioides sp.]